MPEELTISLKIKACLDGCPDFKEGIYFGDEYTGSHCTHNNLEENAKLVEDPRVFPSWCPRLKKERSPYDKCTDCKEFEIVESLRYTKEGEPDGIDPEPNCKIFPKCIKEVFESAKVYVFDFHLSSNNKTEISRKKRELDIFFDSLRNELEKEHNDYVKSDVFLRKH